MRLARVAAAAALISVLGGPSASADAARPASDLPGSAVVTAFDRLAEPSHARPLPGDVPVADDRWVRAGACAEVDAAYQAAGAPIPTGATVAVGARLSLTVSGPFGPSGILVEDQADRGRCVYAIAHDPTVSVSAPGLVTDQFSAVGCASIFGLPFFLTQVDNGGVPTVVVVAHPDQQPWRAVIAPGTADDVKTLTDPPPGAIDASGDATFDGDTLDFTGDGVSGPETIHLACTPFTPLAPVGG